MATRVEQKMEGENLREQLALAVTSIQWSYAIFWSPSSSPPGALEWGEGYYNGDIKTRKTTLAMEMNNDQMGCQRSEQLRELYESLLTGAGAGAGGDTNANHHARRPSAALSPEDLTNAEWYYLICMSFIFNIGQGLPGRSLANGQPIWLSNAHCADTTVFCRSLLAKSAGIKTVVCFPFLSGVIELGATDLVEEDLGLIHHVKTTFLQNSSLYPLLSQRPDYSFAQFRAEVLHADLPPLMQDEDMGLVSPSASSKGFDLIQLPNNAVFFVEGGLNEEAVSQAQSWHLNDDELSNCVHNSMTSSDCISQTFVNPERNVPSSPKNEATNCPSLLEEELLQDPLSEDLHYQSILSSIFKKTHQMDMGMSFHCSLGKGSSFVRWRKGAKRVGEFKAGTAQKMLKAILVEVPRLHDHQKEDGAGKEACKQQEANEPSSNHVLAERRRREKVNERFSVLKSLIPSVSKADKISILDDTIAYLKELERRVQQLESCQELAEYNRKNKRKPQDMEERTSDNYGNDINVGSKNKRRARDNDEDRQEYNQASTKDSSTDNTIAISMVDKDVFIDIRCPWKGTLFLDIIDTLSNLHLDTHSVQSSTADGILSLTVKSKVRGRSSLSVGMITQALQRVLKNG